jgi:protein-disulfide isomerase
VKLTPSVYINDHEIGPNDKTPEGLRAAIDAALKEKEKS